MGKVVQKFQTNKPPYSPSFVCSDRKMGFRYNFVLLFSLFVVADRQKTSNVKMVGNCIVYYTVEKLFSNPFLVV